MTSVEKLIPKGILYKSIVDKRWNVNCIIVQEKEICNDIMPECLKKFVCECLNITLEEFQSNYFYYFNFKESKYEIMLKNSIWQSFSSYLQDNVKLIVNVKYVTFEDCSYITNDLIDKVSKIISNV